jgi:hypothetical protein
VICVCLDSLFLYKAFSRPAHFEIHTEDVGFGIEAGADIHRFKVRVIRAVTPAGDGNELTVEDLRIAFAGCLGNSLDEGFMPRFFLTVKPFRKKQKRVTRFSV